MPRIYAVADIWDNFWDADRSLLQGNGYGNEIDRRGTGIVGSEKGQSANIEKSTSPERIVRQSAVPGRDVESAFSAYIERILQRKDTFPVGPNLRQIQDIQRTRGVREYYGPEHLRRLLSYEAKNPFHRYARSSKQYCAKVHGPGCKVCQTCHFCRQKTIDPKTWCPCSLSRSGNIVGGRGRGYWCGACLEIRMGENLNEVINNPEWRCPACRHLCNCSGKSCQRAIRGLEPTAQLSHEAAHLGYKSVAHYLILTHLCDDVNLPAMMELRAQRPTHTVPMGSLTLEKGKLNLKKDLTRERIRMSTAARVEQQIQLLRREFPLPVMTGLGPLVSQGLGTGILDLDDTLEDEGDQGEGDPLGGGMAMSQTLKELLGAAGPHQGDPQGGENPPGTTTRPGAVTPSTPPVRTPQSTSPSTRLAPKGPPVSAAPGMSGVATDPLDAMPSWLKEGLHKVAPHPGPKGPSPGFGSPTRSHRRPVSAGWHRKAPHKPRMAFLGDEMVVSPPAKRRRLHAPLVADLTAARHQSTPPPDTSPLPHVGLQKSDPYPEAVPMPDMEGPQAVISSGRPTDISAPSSPHASPIAELGPSHTVEAQTASRVSSLGSAVPSLQFSEYSGLFSCCSILAQQLQITLDDLEEDPSWLQDSDGIADLENWDNVSQPPSMGSMNQGLWRPEDSKEMVEGHLRGLLQKYSVLWSEPFVVSKFGGLGGTEPGTSEGGFVMCHAELRQAVDFLLHLALMLPLDEVLYSVCRLMFLKDPFLDFHGSDPRARAIVLDGGFQLLLVLHERGAHDLKEHIEGLMEELKWLAEEYQQLAGIFQDTVDASKEYCIGPLHFTAHPMGMDDEGAETRLVLLRALMHADHEMVMMVLAHIQGTAPQLGPAALSFLTPPLTMLLDISRPFEPQVRTNALAAAYTIMTAATTTQVTPLSLSSNIRTISTSLTDPVERIIAADYPLWKRTRAPSGDAPGPGNDVDGRTSRSGNVGPGDASANGSQVGSMKVEVLAKLYALEVQGNLMQWRDLMSRVLAPYTPGINDRAAAASMAVSLFWEKCSSLPQRHFVVFLLAHVLLCYPAALPGETWAVVEVIKMWMRSLVDYGRRLTVAYLTVRLSVHPSAGNFFRSCVHPVTAIVQDVSGTVRRNFLMGVIQVMQQHTDLSWRILELWQDMDKVVAARNHELEGQGAHPQLRSWQKSVAAILLPTLTLSLDHIGPNPLPGHANNPATALALQLTTWMSSVVQELADTSGRSSYPEPPAMEGATESPIAASHAVREELLKSCWQHLPCLISLLVKMRQSWAQFNTNAMLRRPLHRLLVSLLDLPGTPVTPLKWEKVVLEFFVTALLPHQQMDSERVTPSPGPESTAPEGDLSGSRPLQDGEAQAGDPVSSSTTPATPPPPPHPLGPPTSSFLHLLLGLYFRKFLEDCKAQGAVLAQRGAINYLRLLQGLFQQQVLQLLPTLMLLLPPIIRPLITVMESTFTSQPSLAAQMEVYRLVGQIFKAHTSALQLDRAEGGQDGTAAMGGWGGGRLGPLQKGQAVSVSTMRRCLVTVRDVMMRHSLWVVDQVVSARARAPSVQPVQQQHGEGGVATPILTQEDVTGAHWVISSLLGPPVSMDSSTLNDLAAARTSTMTAVNRGMSPSPQLPADLLWSLAESSLSFLTGLSSTCPYAAQLVLDQVLPYLHNMLVTAREYSRPLHSSYDVLVQEITHQGLQCDSWKLGGHPEHERKQEDPVFHAGGLSEGVVKATSAPPHFPIKEEPFPVIKSEGSQLTGIKREDMESEPPHPGNPAVTIKEETAVTHQLGAPRPPLEAGEHKASHHPEMVPDSQVPPRGATPTGFHGEPALQTPTSVALKGASAVFPPASAGGTEADKGSTDKIEGLLVKVARNVTVKQGVTVEVMTLDVITPDNLHCKVLVPGREPCQRFVDQLPLPLEVALQSVPQGLHVTITEVKLLKSKEGLYTYKTLPQSNINIKEVINLCVDQR